MVPGIEEEDQCGVCDDCKAECRLPPADEVSPYDPVGADGKEKQPMTLVGMEPNAGTVEILKKASGTFNLLDRQTPGINMQVINAAAGATKGYASLSRDCFTPMSETCNITPTDDTSLPGVDIWPVDNFFEISDQLREVLENRQRPIDILHIDTEGHDPHVREKTSKVGGPSCLLYP